MFFLQSCWIEKVFCFFSNSKGNQPRVWFKACSENVTLNHTSSRDGQILKKQKVNPKLTSQAVQEDSKGSEWVNAGFLLEPTKASKQLWKNSQRSVDWNHPWTPMQQYLRHKLTSSSVAVLCGPRLNYNTKSSSHAVLYHWVTAPVSSAGPIPSLCTMGNLSALNTKAWSLQELSLKAPVTLLCKQNTSLHKRTRKADEFKTSLDNGYNLKTEQAKKQKVKQQKKKREDKCLPMSIKV